MSSNSETGEKSHEEGSSATTIGPPGAPAELPPDQTRQSTESPICVEASATTIGELKELFRKFPAVLTAAILAIAFFKCFEQGGQKMRLLIRVSNATLGRLIDALIVTARRPNSVYRSEFTENDGDPEETPAVSVLRDFSDDKFGLGTPIFTYSVTPSDREYKHLKWLSRKKLSEFQKIIKEISTSLEAIPLREEPALIGRLERLLRATSNTAEGVEEAEIIRGLVGVLSTSCILKLLGIESTEPGERELDLAMRILRRIPPEGEIGGLKEELRQFYLLFIMAGMDRNFLEIKDILIKLNSKDFFEQLHASRKIQLPALTRLLAPNMIKYGRIYRHLNYFLELGLVTKEKIPATKADGYRMTVGRVATGKITRGQTTYRAYQHMCCVEREAARESTEQKQVTPQDLSVIAPPSDLSVIAPPSTTNLLEKYRLSSLKKLCFPKYFCTGFRTVRKKESSILLAGPTGSGKSALIEASIKDNVCTAPDSLGDHCGVCDNCCEVDVGRSNSDNFRIVDCTQDDWFEEFGEALIFLGAPRKVTGQEGARRRIIALDEATKIPVSELPKLLMAMEKTKAIIIMAMQTTSHIPKELRDRMVEVNIPDPDRETYTNWLVNVINNEGLKYDSGGVEALWDRTAGNYRETLSVLDSLSSRGLAITSSSVNGDAQGIATNKQPREFFP